MTEKALISMAVHDTEQNARTDFTRKTLQTLEDTVNLNFHRLFIIDNASCGETKEILARFKEKHYKTTLITNETNIGTARAVNMALKQREADQPCIKMDNDIVIHTEEWVELMIETLKREPKIGLLGLKRKDLPECPSAQNSQHRTEMIMLPHEPGQKWIIVEKSKYVIGTCQMFSPALLDAIGYLYQPGVYGWEDVLMAPRVDLAGFWSCFLTEVLIDHIDPGGTDYIRWKDAAALERMQEVGELIQKFHSKQSSIYFDA